MNVVERAKAILLQPAQTWPVIDAEPATVQSIYKDWLIIMIERANFASTSSLRT